MKNIIIAFTALLCFGLTNNIDAQKTDRDNYEVKVDGLGCPFCAFGLEKKFKELKGLKNVKIDMETGIFTFTYPAENPLSVLEVEHQVNEAGYTPIKTKIVRVDGKIEESEEPEEIDIDETMLTTKSFYAGGDCDMCRSRMERAVRRTGAVTEFDWRRKKKMATVTYDKSKVTIRDLEKLIADAGHDTKSFRAEDEKYKSLPECCHYKRNNEND